MNRTALVSLSLASFVLVAACGGSDDDGSLNTEGAGGSEAAGSGTAGSGTAGSATAGSATAGSATAGSGTAGTGTAGSGTAGSGTAGSGAAGSGTAGSGTAGSATAGSGTAGSGTAGSSSGGKDPTKDGPYTVAEYKGTFKVPTTGASVAMDAFYPTGGPTNGPYPLVVFAHGFQLPASQYTGYVKRLASYGYVALTADFQTGFVGVSHVKSAEDVLGGIDWAFAQSDAPTSPLAGKVDKDKVGLSGHSLGGKLSVLGAAMDKRVKASITFDPVDSSVMCSPQDCPDASMKLPLPIPTAFLGETLDGAGGFMPCAPSADNFTTFYAAAASPSLQVTVNGANHMSFIDNPATCGLQCSFCKQATADQKQVIALSYAYFVSFYERHLRGDASYDTWLTGSDAQAAFGKLVTVTSK